MLMSILVDILIWVAESLTYLAINVCQAKVETGTFTYRIQTCPKCTYLSKPDTKQKNKIQFIFCTSDSWQLKFGMATFMEERVLGRARSK